MCRLWCSARYVGEPCHGRFYYRCYARCKKVPTIKEDTLNESVWTALKEAILNPRIIIESVVKHNETRNAEANNRRDEIAQVEKSIQQLETAESRLFEAYRLGVISAAQLGGELEKLNTRRSLMDARKATLNEQAPKLSLPVITQSVSDYCALIANRLETINSEGKQRLLRLLINEVLFDGSNARIRGVIPSARDAQGTEGSCERTASDVFSAGRIATTEINLHGRNPTNEKGPTSRNDLNASPCFSARSTLNVRSSRDHRESREMYTAGS